MERRVAQTSQSQVLRSLFKVGGAPDSAAKNHRAYSERPHEEHIMKCPECGKDLKEGVNPRGRRTYKCECGYFAISRNKVSAGAPPAKEEKAQATAPPASERAASSNRTRKPRVT